jgi:hypothetical protein
MAQAGTTAGSGSASDELTWTTIDVDFGSPAKVYPYRYGYDCLDTLTLEIGQPEADRHVVATDDNALGVTRRLVLLAAPGKPVTGNGLPLTDAPVIVVDDVLRSMRESSYPVGVRSC